MNVLIGSVAAWFAGGGLSVSAAVLPGADPSANAQLVAAFVTLEKGSYKHEDLDADLSTAYNAVTAAQALPINQAHFISANETLANGTEHLA